LWINVSYVGYFNRKRQRRGHLFHGRFKSILVDADEYLKQLSRYIHLNPMRAKMWENISSTSPVPASQSGTIISPAIVTLTFKRKDRPIFQNIE
jgi:hypothetical protein